MLFQEVAEQLKNYCPSAHADVTGIIRCAMNSRNYCIHNSRGIELDIRDCPLIRLAEILEQEK